MSQITPEPDQGAEPDCEIATIPPMVGGIVLSLLRDLYSNPNHIFSPYISGLLKKHGTWRNDEQTGIVIADWTQFNPKLVELRPGIFIRSLGIQRTLVGLGGEQYSEDMATGATSHWTYWSGSVVAMHVANNNTECEFLGWESAKSLTEVSKIVTAQSSLGHFAVMQVGEVRPLKESQKHFAAPVVVNYTCSHSWDLLPELPRLKHIETGVTGGIR